MNRTIAVITWTLACGFSAWAQSPPEISSQETPVTFSSRVNLVTVPVVVRDRDGHAVGGLRIGDFRLFDKGKPQAITKFSVEQTEARVAPAAGGPPSFSASTVAPGSSTPSLPDRYVAYLVDDIHLKPEDLLNMRKAMTRHLEGALRATDRAAIVTTAGVVLSDFTADREKLTRALNSIKPWTNGADSICPGITYYMADILVNRPNGDNQLTGDAAKAANQCGYTSAIQRTALYRQVEQTGERETRFAWGAATDVIRRLSTVPGNRTLVMVSGGFIITPRLRGDEADVFEKALRANIAINTIDARGVWTAGDDISLQGSSMAHYKTDEGDEKADSLAELATNTGGRFFHDDNDLKDGFDQIASRPEFLYVLGFSPQDLKSDGSYHALKVALAAISGAKLPGATLQVRRGYWAPKRSVDAAEAAREQLKEDMFSREEIKDIPIDLHTEFFKSADTKAELTVTAMVNPDKLHFAKAPEHSSDARNSDDLTVVTGVFDDNGNYVQGIQRVIHMHLRDQTLNALRDAGISVDEKFSLAPGRYIVRLVVQDAGGQTTASRNEGVEIP